MGFNSAFKGLISLHNLSCRFYEKNERSGDNPDVTQEGRVFFPFWVFQKSIFCVLLHLPTAVKTGPTLSISLCTICFIMLSLQRFAARS